MENKKVFELLEDIRECSTCSDKEVCREYLFSKLGEDKILEEFRLEKSFTARLLARSLSWMAVEETNMMYIIDENGLSVKDDAFPPPPDFDEDAEDPDEAFEDDLEMNSDYINYSNPIIHHLNETREQMRETIKLLAKLKHEANHKKGTNKNE